MLLDKVVYHPIYVVFIFSVVIINIYMILTGFVIGGILLLLCQVPWFLRGTCDGLFSKGWNKFYRHIEY